MKDVFQIVTDRIIAGLESGTVPWHKPWCLSGKGAFNRVTGRSYSLLNQLLLTRTGEYASYKQWIDVGGKVKKGERAEIIVFWKWMNNDEDDTEEEQTKKKGYPILKYYRVFHISQIEGVTPLEETKTEFSTSPIEKAEELFYGYVDREGIQVIQEYSDRAYYSFARDLIHIPVISQFEEASEFYSTAFHEAVHSTGHSKRLCREGLKKVSFGSATYSKEELVAEIGSAAILHMLGIDTWNSINNSAAYISGWLKALKDDRKLVVIAASQAEKAANLIMGATPDR